MKIFLAFNLLINISFAQTDSIRVVKMRNYFPSLAGVQTGEIQYSSLCDSLGLTLREEGSIQSFVITYQDGSDYEKVQVNGNTIPDSICTKIGMYGLRSMIFITKIEAIINRGTEVVQLNSMNLIPIKRED
jgi:hypothetical protein